MLKVLLAMRVNKWFKREKDISKSDLFEAANAITNGLYDVSLGGGVYKKRLSNCNNKGKSGGSRLLIAYKKQGHIFFMHAFNKAELGNIGAKQKLILKERAKLYFEMAEEDLEKAIKAKVFFEIKER
jgi:hypothetical protein